MEEKIRQYVRYQLYEYDYDQKEALCEEISGNLIERYHDFLNELKDEKMAYLKTISMMGDFLDDKIPDDDYKLPLKYEELAMLLGSIFAGVSFFMLFANVTMGLLFAVASIVFFVVGAHLSYSEAQYARKKDNNMAVYTSRLKRIFSYAKSCFFFWGGVVTIILSLVVTNVYTYIRHGIVLGAIAELEDDPAAVMPIIGELSDIIIMSGFVFVVMLVVVGTLTYFVYWKFVEHYEMLLGESNLHGGLGKWFKFIKQGNIKLRDVIVKALSVNRFALAGLLYGLVPLMFIASTRINYSEYDGHVLYLMWQTMTTSNTGLLGIEFLLLSFGGIVAAILILYKPWPYRMLSLLPPALTFLAPYLLLARADRVHRVDFNFPDAVLAYYRVGIVLIVFFFIIGLMAQALSYLKRSSG